MKRLLASVLSVLMVLSSVTVFGVTAAAEDKTYKVGDIIEFGSYPQSEVKDEDLISALNAQGGTWKSYNYYSGTGYSSDRDSVSNGQMTASDYMRYKDVIYYGIKYRAVTFDSFRPCYTGYKSNASNSYQDDNGYTTGNTYWFKYEPIKWKMLDPSNGFVMCETIIDSQAYSNYIKYNSDEKEYYNDKGTFASDWVNSSLREWLNNDFYNTAFSSKEKENILKSTNSNKSFGILVGFDKYDSVNTEDKVFLLSFDEVTNSAYGFNSNYSDYDNARCLQGSDYANCQGLWVHRISGSENDGNSWWWLRTPNIISFSALAVYFGGFVSDGEGTVGHINYGVVPALKLQNLQLYTTTTAYTAKFVVDGKTVSENKYKEGDSIVKLADPTKEGYTFKCWNPEVPETMPAEDITFKAVFEKNTDAPVDPDNPTANARLNLKALNISVYKNSEVTVIASATGVPNGYVLAVYDEKNEPVVTGANQSVTYKIPGLVNSDKTITIKVIDKDGNVQKDGNGDNLIGTLNIKLKTGFINNIIAFFKKLFKSNNATILV